MFKLLICLVAIILTNSNCQNPNFPLWGTTWMIMQGENQRVLYPSVSPLEPKSVIQIQFGFPKTYRSILNWANLNHHDYAVTSEVMTDIKNQFSKNVIPITNYDKDDSKITIYYKNYDDTVYSCDEALASAPPNFTEYYREVNGTITKFNTGDKATLKSTPLYTKEKAQCWGKRTMTANDLLTYSNCSDEKCFAGQGNSDAAFDNYCDDYTDKTLQGPKSCYESLTKYKFKTDNLGYWTVHLYPEIWYLCRDPERGTPIFDASICPRMTQSEAMAMKQKSLAAPNDLNLRKYRNPYLSDSASTIVSFSFIDDGTSLSPLKSRDYIWLSAQKSGSKIPYEHYPNRMWQVKSQSYDAMNEILLKSYTTSDAEADKMKTLSSRCPEWQTTDEINGKKFYPEKDRVNGHYKADKTIDKGNYIYNECPDYQHNEFFNLTTNQIRKILWQPVPMCSMRSMLNAREFYAYASQYLTKKDDAINVMNRIKQLNYVIDKRSEMQNYDPNNEKFCPEHIIDQFYP